MTRRIFLIVFFSLILAAMYFYHHQKKSLDIFGNLKIYEAYDEHGPIELMRLGKNNDGGYVVPVAALRSADVLLGYGIDNDISFEEGFSAYYQKPSFGFDCGVDKVKANNPLFHFINECIGSSTFVYKHQKVSGGVSTFSYQLKKLELEKKNIFIKMDIEGAEFDAMPDILKYSSTISGVVLEIHFGPVRNNLKQANDLLAAINKDFLLVHVHGNNCDKNWLHASTNHKTIPATLELTYINKKSIKHAKRIPSQLVPNQLDMSNCPENPEVEFTL